MARDPTDTSRITRTDRITNTDRITDDSKITDTGKITDISKIVGDAMRDVAENPDEDFYPFIDVHSHLVPLPFLPPDVVEATFYRQDLPVPFPLVRYASDLVSIVDYISGLSSLIVDAVRGTNSGGRILGTLDAMGKKKIFELADLARNDMLAAGVDCMAPLALDLWGGSMQEEDIECSYSEQINQLVDCIPLHPWKFFPFVMFDPRRPDALDIVKDAISRGAVGVKFYPAMGYNPNPDAETNTAEMKQALEDLYEYCQQFNIPIISHCTAGGSMPGHLFELSEEQQKTILSAQDISAALKEAIIECQMQKVWPFSDPKNWEPVLAKYNIRVNLAHMGSGNWFREEGAVKEIENEWRNDICRMIDTKYAGRVYTDLSSDNEMCLDSNSDAYFFRLHNLLKQDPWKSRILFGIDWPLDRIFHVMSAYVKAYRANLTPSELCQVASLNNVDFIFGESRRIPDAYV
ncbi:amidohydrolase family protein, partial [Candidatus Woesearchaeota archaeon]|nr:amidohydrolase family protein [Candidatus Woesearchaeota archaeon]